MNWVLKFCNQYHGFSSNKSFNLYAPPHEQWGDPEQIYQSKDFPWVFLGSADPDDMQTAEKIAGRPICIRIDLTDQLLPNLPPPTMKVPFPEERMWNDQKYNKVQGVFQQTVQQLASIIKTNQCPIYVHCSLGMNRSVSILSAALSQLTGKSVLDILKEMKTIRGTVLPHDVYVMMAIDSSGNSQEQQNKNTLRQQLNIDSHVQPSPTETAAESYSHI